ncbi:unnamed protein product [Rotaria sordida]|uniref:Uncharacterized protein n=1 Tax=Rotaria sordida TaxID=392033 RepID=A0A815SR03_9BILA|nr:unnamed protein product [Rotaria sordida]CAF4149123.1 unnamed protein product [Rotaria sordida]
MIELLKIIYQQQQHLFQAPSIELDTSLNSNSTLMMSRKTLARLNSTPNFLTNFSTTTTAQNESNYT